MSFLVSMNFKPFVISMNPINIVARIQYNMDTKVHKLNLT